MHKPLHSVYSVHSVVRRNFIHGMHGFGKGASALMVELNGGLMS